MIWFFESLQTLQYPMLAMGHKIILCGQLGIIINLIHFPKICIYDIVYKLLKTMFCK